MRERRGWMGSGTAINGGAQGEGAPDTLWTTPTDTHTLATTED